MSWSKRHSWVQQKLVQAFGISEAQAKAGIDEQWAEVQV